MENMDTYVMVQRGLHHILIPKIKENIEHTLTVLLWCFCQVPLVSGNKLAFISLKIRCK